MASLAAGGRRSPPGRRPRTLALRGAEASAGRTGLGLALAAGLVALALVAGGGQGVGEQAGASIAVLLAGAPVVALAVVRAPGRGTAGAFAVGLFAALTAWVALSVAWSVAPDLSELETFRTLAWLAAFAAGAALARLAPRSGQALLGGVLGAVVVVSGYAVLTKVVPGALAPDETQARLREPFAYWNAVGLMAALGVPACLWLGARREGRAFVSALAAPACALLLTTILLAQSRGALLALALALAVWFAAASLRLRGAAVLGLGLLGSVPVAVWAFSRPALSETGVRLAERKDAGLLLGLLMLAALALVTIAALALGFAAARRPLAADERSRAGIAVLAALTLAILGGLGALAAQPGGIRDQLSSAWNNVSDTNAAPPRGAGRLTATSSARARYWHEALQVWREDRLRGLGAGGYEVARQKVSKDALVVRHAHGYVPQTLADLGLVGLGLSLAVFGAWAGAALRVVRPRGGAPETERDRAAAVTLLAVALVAGGHALVDWTWSVPATAVIGLLCGGWLAGRGPLDPADRAAGRARRPESVGGPGAASGPGRPARRTSLGARARLTGALAVLAVALAGVWGALGPLRADEGVQRGLDELAEGRLGVARAELLVAARRDELSPDPLLALASVEQIAGRPRAARRALVDAVRRAPASPRTWSRLARYDLVAGRLAAAGRELPAGLSLAPRDPVMTVALVQLQDALAKQAAGAPGRP